MSIISSSTILYRNIDLTDQIKLHLEYDRHRHTLNMFVDSTDSQLEPPVPNQINVFVNTADLSVGPFSSPDDNQVKIFYELSTIYTYDEFENDEIIDNSNSTLLSCCDELTTIDHDDGYSTHSSDDNEHPYSLIPTSKSLLSFDSSDFYPTFVRHLIEQTISLNPLRKIIEKMMFHPFFFH